MPDTVSEIIPLRPTLQAQVAHADLQQHSQLHNTSNNQQLNSTVYHGTVYHFHSVADASRPSATPKTQTPPPPDNTANATSDACANPQPPQPGPLNNTENQSNLNNAHHLQLAFTTFWKKLRRLKAFLLVTCLVVIVLAIVLPIELTRSSTHTGSNSSTVNFILPRIRLDLLFPNERYLQ